MRYFAMIDGERVGPLELSQLAEAGVRPSTYVWCKDMADWEKAEDVADICRYFRGHIHDLMHPSAPQPEPPRDYAAERMEEMMEQVPPRFRPYIKNPDDILGPPAGDTRDYSVPPRSMLFPAIVATLLCFPPTGFMAIFLSIKSSKAWKRGDRKDAHEVADAARMWTGITFFMGFIVYAFMLRHLV